MCDVAKELASWPSCRWLIEYRLVKHAFTLFRRATHPIEQGRDLLPDSSWRRTSLELAIERLRLCVSEAMSITREHHEWAVEIDSLVAPIYCEHGS
jgi:hypothetical protein